MLLHSIDIREMSDAELERELSLLTPDKRRQIMSFRFAADRKRSAAGYMLARKTVAGYLSVPESDITFLTDANGKPYVKDLDVYFNISHSGDYAVCAVSDAPVGIDIEKIRDIDSKVIARACNAAETQYIGDSAYRFFEVWTAKEAYAKCTGTGLCDLKADISNGTFKQINIADGYVCTVCTKAHSLE